MDVMDPGIGHAPRGAGATAAAVRALDPTVGPGAIDHADSTSGALPRRVDGQAERPNGWTFLTNHAHVLVALALDPRLRIRDVAGRVGITERAAQRILHDLVAEGYVEREKHGRRNTYRLALDRPLRHPIEAGHTVGALIDALCRGR